MMERYRDTALSPKERAEDLLRRMTVREKVGQLNQRLYGFRAYRKEEGVFLPSEEFCREAERFGGLGILYGLYRADPWSGRTYENGLSGEDARLVYNELQRCVLEHSRFGIPMLLSTESPHGHQALDGYLLPVNLAVGAAFDVKLAEQAARVCAREEKAMGADLALVSMLDVLRDPRWGRSEECFGEDPYLAAVLAAAVTRGMRAEGMEVVAKHFAAQGETTGGVNASAARIGERELREIHLPPARAAVLAGASGIMAAYNEIDGIPCHANPWLLQTVLRDEMGFEGIVMADGFAVDRLAFLGCDPAECGAEALNAGVDVSLWDEGFARLEEALERGLICEKRLDQAVLRVLTMKFERGLFEHPYLDRAGQGAARSSCQTGDPGEERLHRDPGFCLAKESVVLLKNDGCLPLGKKERRLPLKNGRGKMLRVALAGERSRDLYAQLGDYSPPMREKNGWTVERGLQEAAKRLGGMEIISCADREAAAVASESDVTILVLGGSSSRFGTVRFDKNGAALTGTEEAPAMDCGEGVDLASLSLPPDQLALADEVLRAAAGPVITIVIAGRPYIITELAERSNALLYAFYPGPCGGRALAELIVGEGSPSGRLPASLPRSCGQLPVYYNPRSSYEAMHYCDEREGPLYPFGYGLGYADAEYAQMRLEKGEAEGETAFRVSFDVSNPSESALFAVPMVFVRRSSGSVIPRRAELKGFARQELRPGETKQMSIEVTFESLALWNRKMERVFEGGSFFVELRDGKRVLWSAQTEKFTERGLQ